MKPRFFRQYISSQNTPVSLTFQLKQSIFKQIQLNWNNLHRPLITAEALRLNWCRTFTLTIDWFETLPEYRVSEIISRFENIPVSKSSWFFFVSVLFQCEPISGSERRRPCNSRETVSDACRMALVRLQVLRVPLRWNHLRRRQLVPSRWEDPAAGLCDVSGFWMPPTSESFHFKMQLLLRPYHWTLHARSRQSNEGTRNWRDRDGAPEGDHPLVPGLPTHEKREWCGGDREKQVQEGAVRVRADENEWVHGGGGEGQQLVEVDSSG